MKQMSFPAACKDYFGLKPNQTLQEFAVELRTLTEEDRAELKSLFPSVGYNII